MSVLEARDQSPVRVGKESVEACNPSIQAGRAGVWGQPGLLSKHFKNEVKVLHMLSHLGGGGERIRSSKTYSAAYQVRGQPGLYDAQCPKKRGWGGGKGRESMPRVWCGGQQVAKRVPGMSRLAWKFPESFQAAQDTQTGAGIRAPRDVKRELG